MPEALRCASSIALFMTSSLSTPEMRLVLVHANSVLNITRSEPSSSCSPCSARPQLCGVMGNDASRMAVVDVFLVRAQVGARRGTEAILLHWQY